MSFEQVDAFSIFDIPVKKYRSSSTGLTVSLAHARGPLVGAYLALATEAHDHDGLPHTLEHLVFLGSEDYPYKGVLDLIANRSLAQGTNAWTATDHTCYTLTTAGEEGMLNALPVYLDHVLYPTLTETGYTTEVHHINGEGEDLGVVYSEMKGIENRGESRTYRRLIESLYPGESGYKSETGGMLWNLRESCSHAKVRQYHRDYYRPDNLNIMIVGGMDPDKLFAAIAPFEKKVASKLHPKLPRPWSSVCEPLTQTVEHTVEFPTEDESSGMALIGWRGPSWHSFLELTALSVLWQYLTDTPVAPLQRELVETESPYCTDMSTTVERYSSTCFHVSLDDVPADKLGRVGEKVFQVLEAIATGKEPVNMERMATVIHQLELQLLSQADDEPHELFVGAFIEDFCYGTDQSHLKERLSGLDQLKALAAKTASFWQHLIQTQLLDSPHVLVLGKPSAPLGEEMVKQEAERVAAQRAALGPEKLADLGKKLANASKANSVETPNAILEKIPVPSVESIPFHSVDVRSPSDASAVPFHVEVEKVSSPFVTVVLALNTSALSAELRPYLPLYLSMFFESAVKRKDPSSGEVAIVPHEQVIDGLAADTLQQQATLGFSGRTFLCGMFAQYALLVVKTEKAKYAKTVNWVRELLFHIHFTAERIKVNALNLVNEVANTKRDGMKTTVTLLNELLISPAHVTKSNHTVTNVVRQHRFLAELLESFGVSPALAEGGDDEGDNKQHGRDTLGAKEDAGDEEEELPMEDKELASHHTAQEGHHHSSERHAHHGLPSHGTASDASSAGKSLEEIQAAADAAIRALESLRDGLLADPAGVIVSVAGDFASDEEALSAWTASGFVRDFNAFAPGASAQASAGVGRDKLAINWTGELVAKETGLGRGVIVALSSVESAYLIQACPCVDSWDHPDLPALLVAIEYLTALEGPLWRNIRGLGLSYSYGISLLPEIGSLTFRLFRSTDVAKAYKVAKAVINAYVTGEAPKGADAADLPEVDTSIDPLRLEAAIAGAMYGVIEDEKSVFQAALQSFLCVFRKVPQTYHKALMQSMRLVTAEQVKLVLGKYVLRLFDADVASTSVCCNPNKLQDFYTGLGQSGVKLTIVESMENCVAL